MSSNSENKQSFSAHLDVWFNNLAKTGRSRKQAVSVAVDSTIVAFSLWAAYTLRHGMVFSDFASTWYLFLFLPTMTVIIFMSLGIYRWVVRSSNRKLFRQLIKACIASAMLLILLSFLIPPDRANPRSLFVIYGLLLVVGTCGIRFLWIGLFDAGRRGEPVAIYGAGMAGQQLMQSLTQGNDFRPVLFIDDNTALAGTTLSGIPVVCPEPSLIDNYIAGYEVERVILAMPTMNATEYQNKIEKFKTSGVPVLTIPTYAELALGSASFGEVRDISIGDILGRSEVPANPQLIGECVTDKVVLVSGGGGSIGSELCRQIVLLQPRKLIVLDHSESNLYQITEELKVLLQEHTMPFDLFLPCLNSIKDFQTVLAIFKKEKVQTVYHAAAYKHVPIIESQPEQGLSTNIFGTLKLVDAAIQTGVENFVLISTDKAVRPTNCMGASKRIAELILQAKSRTQQNTRVSMVRFGNVLGSSGSVVPKFKKQIEEGGPITLTDLEITRYFMTIPEAAQLVLQASAVAEGGDVFVLDMGEPVKIADLAETMVRLAGKRLKRDTGRPGDIEIMVEGLRPGEKMFEELFITDSYKPTDVSKVFAAEEASLPWHELTIRLQKLQELQKLGDSSALREELLKLAWVGSDSDEPNKESRKRDHTEYNLIDQIALESSVS